MESKVRDMTPDEVKQYMGIHTADTYNLVDVRQDWEYEEYHVPGARLIPLPELTDRMNEIPADKPTLVYCALGGRSASAANLLKGQGVSEVYNMVGGITAWKNETAVGPQSLGIIYFSGQESPLDILGTAYALEANLEVFYSGLIPTAEPALADAFTQLAKFEKGHKAKIFNLAREQDPSIEKREDLDKRSSIEALEGGMTAEDFLAANREFLETPKGTLEAAMMFEAQALDLYLRCASTVHEDASIDLFHTLAQEEKGHIRVIGKLMDRMPR